MLRQDMLKALCVVVIWGLNFIAIKKGLAEVPPLLLGALRFLAASVPAALLLPRPPVSWKWLLFLGLSINVGQFSFLFLGMKAGMPAGLASLLLQAQAFFTLLFAVVWFGEHWRWNHLVGLAVAAGGMTLIGMQQGGEMTAAGFMLTMAAAASWGLGNVVMRRTTLGVPPFSMLSLVVWAGVVAILPLLALSWFLEGPALWCQAFGQLTWNGVGAVVYLSYVATLGGYGLWGKLLSRYSAASVAPWALLVPLVGMSSAALLLGERLSLGQSLGAVAVMTGLLVHVFGGGRK